MRDSAFNPVGWVGFVMGIAFSLLSGTSGATTTTVVIVGDKDCMGVVEWPTCTTNPPSSTFPGRIVHEIDDPSVMDQPRGL